MGPHHENRRVCRRDLGSDIVGPTIGTRPANESDVRPRCSNPAGHPQPRHIAATKGAVTHAGTSQSLYAESRFPRTIRCRQPVGTKALPALQTDWPLTPLQGLTVALTTSGKGRAAPPAPVGGSGITTVFQTFGPPSKLVESVPLPPGVLRLANAAHPLTRLVDLPGLRLPRRTENARLHRTSHCTEHLGFRKLPSPFPCSTVHCVNGWLQP